MDLQIALMLVQDGIVNGAIYALMALALVLPIHTLEPFLLMLSSVFVPLYGVILGRLGTGVRASVAAPLRGIDWGAASLWIAGIALYHACARLAPQFGSALPTLALTFTLAWATRPTQSPLAPVQNHG